MSMALFWVIGGAGVLLLLLVALITILGCKHEWKRESAMVDLTGHRGDEAGVVVMRSCPKCKTGEAWVEYLSGSKPIGLDLARHWLEEAKGKG